MRLLQEDDFAAVGGRTILRGHSDTVNGKKKNNLVSSDFPPRPSDSPGHL